MQQLGNDVCVAVLRDPDNGSWGHSDDCVAAAGAVLVAAHPGRAWGGPEVDLAPEGAQGIETSMGLHPHIAPLPSIAPGRAACKCH